MKQLLKIEEFALFLLALYLFTLLDFAWWWFPLLFLAPDLGMLGYLAGPGAGAWAYNLVHHKGIAVVVYVAGALATAPVLQLAGVILLGHSSLDRVFGYGLKYPDAFSHTHLGRIGRST